VADNNKYGGRATGLWRRTYGYSSRKPVVITFVNTATDTTMSVDLNKTIRHRDFYIINGIPGGTANETPVIPPVDLAEYDEGVISVLESDVSILGYFNFTFSSDPIIVLTADSASNWGENVNIYGLYFDTQQFVCQTSAPFSGTIRYRAIYSPTYPAYCTSSYTSSITASAGIQTLNFVDSYTASFSALPGTPFKFLQTLWPGSNYDVALSASYVDSDSANVEISDAVSASVHFIAYYS